MLSQILLQLNWLHILVAAIAYFGLGSLWYSPILFSKQWIQLTGINMDEPNAKEGFVKVLIMCFLLTFLVVAGIGLLQHFLMFVTFISGLKVGFFVGVFFASTAISINYLYNKKPFTLYIIDCGYQTLGCGIAGAILGAWH
jgi:hypothetical protein